MLRLFFGAAVLVAFGGGACGGDRHYFGEPERPPITAAVEPPDLTSNLSSLDIIVKLQGSGFSVPQSVVDSVVSGITIFRNDGRQLPANVMRVDPTRGADIGAKYLRVSVGAVGEGWTSIRLQLPTDVIPEPISIRTAGVADIGGASGSDSIASNPYEVRLSTDSIPVLRALRLCPRDDGAIMQAILEFSELVMLDSSEPNSAPAISVGSERCSLEPLVPPDLAPLGVSETKVAVFRCPPLTEGASVHLALSATAFVGADSNLPVAFWESPDQIRSIATGDLPITDGCLLWKD